MAGDYTLTVIDANGCTDSASTTVVVYPKPTPPIPPITRPQQAQYFSEKSSVQGVGEIFYEKTILASGVGVREYMWGDTGNGTFAMTITEILNEGVRLNCSGNCSDMGKIMDPIYGDDESPVMTNFECKKMVQFEIGAKDNPLIYGLEGEAIYSNPGFSGGMNAQVKEYYAVSSLQKDETAKMTTTATYNKSNHDDDDWKGCGEYKAYNANELNFDTKNAFTGSWGTDSSWEKVCSKDIKHHQYFDGTFQVDKNLMFQEEVTKPCPEKEPHGDC